MNRRVPLARALTRQCWTRAAKPGVGLLGRCEAALPEEVFSEGTCRVRASCADAHG